MEVEAELLGVGDPGRMIAADPFAAAFNLAARNKVMKVTTLPLTRSRASSTVTW